MQFLVFNINFTFISSQWRYRLRGQAEALTKAYQEHKKKLLEEMTEEEANALTDEDKASLGMYQLQRIFL